MPCSAPNNYAHLARGEPTLAQALAVEAHVWLCRPALAASTGRITGYYQQLDNGEQARYRRIQSPEARQQHLAAQALLRHVLTHYHPLPAHAWRFTRGAHGRPEIANADATHLRFNLSHTAGLVGCVVTRDMDCGIDIEHRDRPCAPELSSRILTGSEWPAFAALDEQRRSPALIEYWVLKEAWLKACGLGLAGGLASAAFRFDDAREHVTGAEFTYPGQRGTDWQFALHRLDSGHLLALALKRGQAADCRIVIRTISL
jgi:4'-phosphopantetheinyl transferase